MEFSSFLLALLFAAVVYAQNGQNSFTYPLGGTLDSSGPITISWTPSTTGTVTIKLLKGPPTNILDTDVIAASIVNSGSFTWTIPKSLQDSRSMTPGDKYGFKIIDNLTNTFEYSPPFDIQVTDSTFGGGSASEAPAPVPSSVISSEASTSATPTPSVIAPTSTPSATPTPSPSPTTPIIISQPVEVQSGASTPIATETSTQTQPTTLATVVITPTAEANTGNPGGKDSGPNIPLVAGIAGAVGGLGIAIVAIFLVVRRRNRRKEPASDAAPLMEQAPTITVTQDGMYNRV